jgi:HAMP domain-containing protein
MGSLVAVFALLFVALNVMLNWLIVKPIARMSHVADQVSTGNFEIPEFPERGKDEIALLGRAFNRMRRSLQKAMQMIEARIVQPPPRAHHRLSSHGTFVDIVSTERAGLPSRSSQDPLNEMIAGVPARAATDRTMSTPATGRRSASSGTRRTPCSLPAACGQPPWARAPTSLCASVSTRVRSGSSRG